MQLYLSVYHPITVEEHLSMLWTVVC